MAENANQPRRCSIAATLEVVGDRWSLLVVREMAYGAQRFNELQRALGAPRDILTARLRKLEAAGVIAREQSPDSPSRPRYVMTPAGGELGPVLMALKEWGDRHVYPGDEPVVVEHSCGAVFHPEIHCAACGEAVTLSALEVTGGDDPLPRFALPSSA